MPEMDQLLDSEEVLGHELVYGELLMGDRGGRPALLALYRELEWVPPVSHWDVVDFVAARGLHGRGIGWVDAHLLASSVAAGTPIWTADLRFAQLAAELRVGYRLHCPR